jgi:hypothetical protein
MIGSARFMLVADAGEAGGWSFEGRGPRLSQSELSPSVFSLGQLMIRDHSVSLVLLVTLTIVTAVAASQVIGRSRGDIAATRPTNAHRNGNDVPARSPVSP